MPLDRTLIGASLRRVEDERFLTGAGQFVGDIAQPGELAAHVVRSPHAHGIIKHLDLTHARSAPGVLGVFIADDLAELGPLPCQVAPPTIGPLRVPDRYALARDRVRYVGEPVALIVAESPMAARDAAELVVLEIETLAAVTDAAAALGPQAPQLWPSVEGNLAYLFEKGDQSAVAAAFANAAHTVSLDLVNNRVIVAALEHRGAVGQFDRATGIYRLCFSGAQVHGIRDALADTIFRVPHERMIVSAPDVGGGFGVKNAVYPEYILVLWAAARLGRPVRWTSDHTEDFISTAHGRDNLTRARLALAADGTFLALDVETVANLGAAMSSGGPGSSTTAPANVMGSGYRFGAVSMRVRGAYTNTVPTDAYRGAGKPEANYLLERLVDAAAIKLGRDPVELRRQNLVSAFPHRTPMATTIDGGRFAENLDPALTAAGVAGFATRRAASQARGMLRGIGITCYLETARGAPDEGAEIRFEADGRIALILGSQSNGQGHETSFPQLAASVLGLEISAFRYVQADTEKVRAGHGHGGARSLHLGGAALMRAADLVIEKGRVIAARLLQCKPGDVHFENGCYAGPVGRVTLLEAAAQPGESLDTYIWNELDLITFPNGVHIAEVEIDPETGAVDLQRYVAVDDFGTVLNPALTLGQVHGGVA
ncbi:MAG: xanthine dehydrogenase family protein molybdopterin-binding subunit, partial [Pseudomonadota bacterium]|nr:xanthine dehydrogenase family protein molybdopterin-binding subunit [Pseudomonadota bacterium]